MDSLDLFDESKMKIEYIKNQTIKANRSKFSKFTKYLDLKTIILFSILFSNLYILYSFRTINNFKKLFPERFISKNSKSENTNKVGKAESIIKESFSFQKDFCINPNKYLNQQYENMINLTDFRFKNIEYKLYVYKEGDNHISNYIIRKKGYDDNELKNFYDALEF